MGEKEKLLEAASRLGFDLTDEEPLVLGLDDTETCQIHARGVGDRNALFVGSPSRVQCAAMRASLYFWKVLRLVEVAVVEDAKLDSRLVLRFEDVDIPVDLPDTLQGGLVTPVRVMANTILGKLNDEAFATLGVYEEEEEVTQRKKVDLPDVF